jgi:hypothetical protein
MPSAKDGSRSVKKFPCNRSIEVLDEYGLQERRLEIAQVYPMAVARRGFKRFPVGYDAARPAAYSSQGPITPDITFRVFGMALDRHRPKWVIGPYSSRAPAQRTVATRGFNGRRRQGQSRRSAMAGSLQRWRWLFVAHGDVSLAVVAANA